ncbi:MAG TPA: aspartate aminotransferase family protein [Polyangiaceae bacterium]|jgi:4-aminobutyrate aminotransferase/(S)-3-amino-2-methylpropionate transaminase|nr:aspartate aminotransferase family protein [Polyangiaceae bacterium]
MIAPTGDPAGLDQGEPPRMIVRPPGPASIEAVRRLERVECPAFGERRAQRSRASEADMTPIVLASAKGSNIEDVDGNRYVDLVAGFGSVLLGHGAAPVVRAVEAQSARLIQALGDVYSADVKVRLLEELAALHPGEAPKVLLSQSGSDAVTAAIKTAALATNRPGLVAFSGSYHGLGYAPLPACGLRESYRAPFADQLNPHVAFTPYPGRAEDLDSAMGALAKALRKGDVGAVLVEPILGRGGCVVPPDGFLRGVCEEAHRSGALVIADEVWTGLGRSGSMVRSLGAPVDILCFGKGLGGGLPISACVAPDAIMGAWARGGEVVHTSTHAGLPLACAAALATLEELRSKDLAARARSSGERAKRVLEGELGGRPGVVAIRGEGLMIGIELESGAVALRASRGLLERGYIVLTGGTRGEVLTLTPALTIPEGLLAGAAVALRESLGP